MTTKSYRKDQSEASVKYHRRTWPIVSALQPRRMVFFWKMRKLAEIKPGERVLELGCGYPFFRMYSGKVGKNGSYTGVDVDPKIIDFNRRFVKNANHKFLSRAAHFKLPKSWHGKFDRVIVNNFWLDYDAIFKVLKPGGKLVRTDIEVQDVRYYTEDVMKRHGFRNIKVKEVFPRHGKVFGLGECVRIGTKPRKKR